MLLIRSEFKVCENLTYGLGHSHDLSAVKGQVTEGPDDGVNLLHDVQRDGHDAARVLTHSNTPTTKILYKYCLKMNNQIISIRSHWISPTHYALKQT